MKHPWIAAGFLLTACSHDSYRPSTTPLAKVTYGGAQPVLYVGKQQAPVSPFDGRFAELLDEQARPLAEQSRIDARTAFLVNLGTMATAVSVLVLALVDAEQFFDTDTRMGRATIGLTVSSAVLGAYAGVFAKRSQSELQQAVHKHNDLVLQRATAGVSAQPEPPALPAESAPPAAPPAAAPPAVTAPSDTTTVGAP